MSVISKQKVNNIQENMIDHLGGLPLQSNPKHSLAILDRLPIIII